MIVVAVVLILFLGGIVAWLSEALDKQLPRVVALSTTTLVLISLLAWQFFTSSSEGWMVLMKAAWLPRFGIHFQVGMDGLSYLLVLLTAFLGVMACGAAWSEIKQRTGFFYFNLLWTLAGVVGVFVALDLFLFFFFWEVMLIPMYFIIAIWGHENKNYAAMKFFIFTQLSGLLMLIGILLIAYYHFTQFGYFSFDYFELQRVSFSPNLEMIVMLGFFLAFTTKLPAMFLHSWLPDAHSQAPTAGSVLLAGVLLKTGAYGLIRFCLPLFPDASQLFAPVAMSLGVAGILYCAVVAFAQTDIKRLIAYTSVSHMGFVLLGVYAGSIQGLHGAVMTMLAHGLSAAALFMLAGGIQHRIHTRDMRDMGGFWAKLPMMSAFALFFSIAALGMPGLGNFVGEFLVLLGAFDASILLTVLAATGLILASIYSLWVIQKVFHGDFKSQAFKAENLVDINRYEALFYLAMAIGLIWMGLYPQTFLEISSVSLQETLPNMTVNLALE